MNPFGYDSNALQAIIPLGKGGLFTDAAQVEIPPTHLIRANNCYFWNGTLEKEPGSRRWNSSALPAGVINGIEYFPDFQVQNQRVLTLLSDGTVYKFPNYYTQTLVTASGSAPATLKTSNYTSILTCGNEQTNNPKKVFVMTGYDPVQVISGDNNTRSNIANPPTDWSGTNQPFGGVLYRNRLFAWGCPNNPHQVYASLATDHENFTSQPLSFTVYPGEGDYIVGGGVFRGRLYIAKYPLGLYYLEDSDTSSTNWFFKKFGGDDFGGVSPQGFLSAKDDLFVANNYGSITSLKAALVYGDLMTADIFSQLSVFRYFDQDVRPDVFNRRQMLWYGKRKQLLVTYQSYANYYNDRILVIDLSRENAPPKVSWTTKDQPNCLFSMRNNLRVAKPFYGANDGYLYEMDVADRWVGVGGSGSPQTAYTFEAQTPDMDFGQGDIAKASLVKTYDFLEIVYEPMGDWDLSIDVYIDGVFSETLTCNMSASPSTIDQYPLGVLVLDGRTCRYRRFPLHGDGRTIGFRFYQSGLGQNVSLARAIVYYRPSTQQQTVG